MKNITTPENPPPTVVIDPEGDLILQVGPGKYEYKVQSLALKRASPVFKSKLFGGWAESQKPVSSLTPWVVRLENEQPTVIEFLVRLAHADFIAMTGWADEQLALLAEIKEKGHDGASDKFDLDFAYDLFITANYYDMGKLLTPWLHVWAAIAQEASPVPKLREKGQELLMALSIAWELGDEKVFRDRMVQLVMGASLDEEDRLVALDGTVIEDFDMIGPQRFIKAITKLRTRALRYILETIKSEFNIDSVPPSWYLTGEASFQASKDMLINGFPPDYSARITMPKFVLIDLGDWGLVDAGIYCRRNPEDPEDTHSLSRMKTLGFPASYILPFPPRPIPENTESIDTVLRLVSDSLAHRADDYYKDNEESRYDPEEKQLDSDLVLCRIDELRGKLSHETIANKIREWIDEDVAGLLGKDARQRGLTWQELARVQRDKYGNNRHVGGRDTHRIKELWPFEADEGRESKEEAEKRRERKRAWDEQPDERKLFGESSRRAAKRRRR